MTAKEIVELIITNTACQYSTDIRPDKVYTKDALIKMVDTMLKESFLNGQADATPSDECIDEIKRESFIEGFNEGERS